MYALWDLKGGTENDRPLRLENFLVFVLVPTGSMTPAQGLVVSPIGVLRSSRRCYYSYFI